MKESKKPIFVEPQIEFRGNRCVVIEGCAGILEYEPETIKLNLGKYNIRLSGQNLELKNLSLFTVMIEGEISELEFRV